MAAAVRPRRKGVNYENPISFEASRNTVLSSKRKALIREYKDKNKRGIGSLNWIAKLHKFLNDSDKAISKEDVNRWIERHTWISDKEESGGAPHPQPTTAASEGDSSEETELF